MLNVGWFSPVFRPLHVLHREIRLQPQHLGDRALPLLDQTEIGTARSHVAVRPPVQQIYLPERLAQDELCERIDGGVGSSK